MRGLPPTNPKEVNVLVLLELIGDFIKRVSLTPEQLQRALASDEETQDEPIADASPISQLMKKYVNMYLNDFFQLAGYADEEYRQVMKDIHDEIVSDPPMQVVKKEDMKRFSDFSRQMLKVLRTYLKERLPPEQDVSE